MMEIMDLTTKPRKLYGNNKFYNYLLGIFLIILLIISIKTQMEENKDG